MLDENLIARARFFAKEAHHGQLRKYSVGQPYLVHPLAVAGYVRAVGGSSAMIAAALLHDVLEDTPVSVFVLRENFGDAVTRYVVDLTDQYTATDYPTLNRAARKRKEAARYHLTAAEVQTIKLADMVDNTIGLATLDAKFAATYLPEIRHLYESMPLGHFRLRQLLEAALLIEEAVLAKASAA